jgi:hypothetical protein
MAQDPRSSDKTIAAVVLGCIGLLVLGVIAVVVVGALFYVNARNRALERAKMTKQWAIAEERLAMSRAEIEKLKAERVACRERAAMLKSQVAKARALLVRDVSDSTRERLSKSISRDLAEVRDLNKKLTAIDALIEEKRAVAEKHESEREKARAQLSR